MLSGMQIASLLLVNKNTEVMKANILKTGRYLFLLAALFSISVYSFSQDKKLSRKERKEVEKAQLARNFYIIDSLFAERSFVLEADYLQDKYGTRIPVTSTINFIKVNKDEGVLQTGNTQYVGYNGLGGTTAVGNVGKWKISKNFKNMSYNVQFYIASNLGHYDVALNVNAANYATATITGLGPGKLSWVGHLVTLDNSRVFKGTTSY